MGPEYVSGAILLSPVDPVRPSLLQRLNPLARATPQLPYSPPGGTAEAVEPYDESNDEQAPNRWMPNPFRRRPATPSDPVDDSESAEPEMDEAEEEGALDTPETAPRKRNWFWPIPRRLPDDAELDAKKLDSRDTSEPSDPQDQ
jgi:hypothetical protein